eukprot:scaffold2263_cov391-Prasinococcus_capsulatus_cf.AAC.8
MHHITLGNISPPGPQHLRRLCNTTCEARIASPRQDKKAHRPVRRADQRMGTGENVRDARRKDKDPYLRSAPRDVLRTCGRGVPNWCEVCEGWGAPRL